MTGKHRAYPFKENYGDSIYYVGLYVRFPGPIFPVTEPMILNSKRKQQNINVRMLMSNWWAGLDRKEAVNLNL
jgi:hypothetical protein